MTIENELISLCIDESPPRNKPLVAKYLRSFAFPVLSKLSPFNITKTGSYLVANKTAIIQKYGPDAEIDINYTLLKLDTLKAEILSNKPFRKLESDNVDVKIWNQILEDYTDKDGNRPTWLNTIWLYGECYVHRRLFETFETSKYLRDYDPFYEQKMKSLVSCEDAMEFLSDFLIDYFQRTSIQSRHLREDLPKILKCALWGNRCDLSQTGGDTIIQTESPLKLVDSLQNLILVDESSKIVDFLCSFNREGKDNKILDIILDNAGYELFSDLCMADYFVTYKIVNTVRFHGKAIPWFVSDVTRRDFFDTIDYVANKSGTKSMKQLGKRWEGYIQSDQWKFENEQFWTLPFHFGQIKSMDPELYEKLSESILIISKGDLNYRKLVGDVFWEPTVPFSQAVGSFKPSKLIALRTLKSDITCGLPEGLAERISQADPDWLKIGKYAVIHVDGV
ncbi:damage-control phosphatase ARMT1-like [Daktulosphaira vitifoliae]|uniref:damage-control phosphatase ARMT1-like n=1 Tax=Daktulosphaira vitifoliae TaxID=58002 RepID=UPI0021A993C6|nr:damage-control phosphatase ARMT1-like [Daktulosphaira vitifoliae]